MKAPQNACSGCQYLMVGRWAPWCHKAGAPLLAVKICPHPHVRRYYEPLDVRELVSKSYTFKTDSEDNAEESM